VSLRERTDVVDAARTTARFATALALTCLTVHVALVPLGGVDMLTMSLPMLALSLACVSCVRTTPGQGLARRQVVGLAAGGVAMVLVHLLVQHGGGHAAMAMGPRTEVAHLVMHGGVTLSAVQAVMALIVLAASPRAVR
jgi:hypothetical protein